VSVTMLSKLIRSKMSLHPHTHRNIYMTLH